MTTMLIGANGQLGSDIVLAWHDGLGPLVPLLHADIEVTERASIAAAFDAHRPAVVINTSAFHLVDLCEDEPERAFATNAVAALWLADACRAVGATLVHISTDYVFSGAKRAAYTESDPTDAPNVYGMSKAAGEQLIRQRLAQHYIVRSSGLYGVAGVGGKGGNFVERMLQLAGERRDLRVVDDQVSAPTFTADLAATIVELLAAGAERAPYGTYHITNAGEVSWHDFARTIFEMSGVEAKLAPTTSAAFGAKAVRPSYSVLANDALRAAGIAQPRPWRDALAEYLTQKGHIRKKLEARS
ncbi:MAG TPA: dTDP-4-dehydrorhamnose reductase [Vicinamibacterales bacterium]|nr:dTDP-4-dehydrorhamnose reductase [Vicinamibacterales bacterium]